MAASNLKTKVTLSSLESRHCFHRVMNHIISAPQNSNAVKYGKTDDPI